MNTKSFTFPKNFLKIIYFIFGGAGLCCCVGFSPVAESRDYSPVVVPGLLNAVASLITELGL